MVKKEQPSEPQPTEAPVPGVEVVGLYLQEAVFKRIGTVPAADVEKTPLEFELSLARPSVHQLGVQIAVTAAVDGLFEAKVIYRVELTGTEGSHERTDEFWKDVASKLAPVILYPYIRETLSTLIAKAGFPPAHLPILNVGQIWSRDEMDLPTPAAKAD